MDQRIRQLERAANAGDPEAAARLKREHERAELLPPMSLQIDGETFADVEATEGRLYGWDMAVIVTDDGAEFYVAADSDSAGRAARDYWREMAETDPTEFRHMVGDETLVRWALGQYAGPGSTQVRSLDDWLDLWLSTPEEHWASYDGAESAVERVSADLIEVLGFTPEVAYRAN